MKRVIRFIIIPILLLALSFVGYKFYGKITLDSTANTVTFIQKHRNNSGMIVDYNNEIGVESIDDIKLFVTDKKIKIQFGYLTMTWKPKDFVSAENRELLKKIGITMYKDKETGRLKVYYNGEEIVRWVS